jgi:hypothetical protein
MGIENKFLLRHNIFKFFNFTKPYSIKSELAKFVRGKVPFSFGGRDLGIVAFSNQFYLGIKYIPYTYIAQFFLQLRHYD